MSDHAAKDFSAKSIICVDLGTTNTRIWLVDREGRIVNRAQAQVGVRDTAREGSTQLLRTSLRSLIGEVSHSAADAPACVIAAGMITSALGLMDVPHVMGPAGLKELAGATLSHQFPDVTDLPVLLVPGVRTGTLVGQQASAIGQCDIMRGEETLCIGLLASGQMREAGTVISLGSHWKAIQSDDSGQITSSVTSLSGEMIHAIQTTTILSSSLPATRPETLDPEWIALGMAEQRRSGLARSLFCGRLLQLAGSSTPEQRFAFVIGAFIAADMDSLLASGKLFAGGSMILVGNPALTAAWHMALRSVSIQSIVLNEQSVEAAMLTGLREILKHSSRC